ncbi:hypothetical protein [Alicyclobacillus fastidiosus]|uniref:Uncharacterized protein n=1 Tax=Alicyclobacillus fastidiosus TaxID=392011 RepID=A0ABV5ADP5_9BACL|nr:hypothetical protein [Alicyclobacillus fastidiosus]WEH08599.1 hypothetical protein PYS47_18195 [Alicyclobacillus fastidiosus]
MSKKSKQHKRRTDVDLFDKPDYAMDVVADKPKKAPKEKPKEEAFHVGDTIGDQAASKLAALKAKLEDVADKQQQVKAAKPQKPVRTAKERLDENPDLSFAELFDPQEDEEASFDELLKDSKLDWRYFKDE